MSSQTIDHEALGLSRLATQFTESPNMIAALSAILALCNELEAAFQSLFFLPYVDQMQGVNLDVIGIIVGVDRNITGVVQFDYFGFPGFSYMKTMGELGDPSVGARFYELGESFETTNVLNDPEFRQLIKCKIIKNASSCTPEDIMTGLRTLLSLSGGEVEVYEPGVMTYAINLARDLSAVEKAILSNLDVLARPAAVKLVSITTPDEVITF